MRKAAVIVMVIGALLIAGGIAVIFICFSQANSDENALVFDKKVTAQITNTRVTESKVGQHKNKNATGYTGGHTEYHYYVEITADGISKEQSVSKSLYDEYSALEKNVDMEFYLYRNPDGSSFFSLKDLEVATAEYRSGGHITKNIAVRMIAAMVAAFVGIGTLQFGGWLKKKTERSAY